MNKNFIIPEFSESSGLMIDAYKVLCRKAGFKPRSLILEVLKSLDEDFSNNRSILYIVKAPTGYGKTSISLSAALFSLKNASFFEKVIHVLPLRAIVEDAFHKANRYLGLAAGKQMMGVSISPFLLYPITFVTIDTFLWDTIKLNTKKWSEILKEREYGYDYFTQASIIVSLIFFDEVHMVIENDNLRKIFFTVLEFLTKNRVPIIFLTATMPPSYEKYFINLAEVKGYKYRCFPENELKDDFIENEEKKVFHIRLEKSENIGKLIDLKKRNLIIVNTVRRAVEIYKNLKRYSKDIDVMLIHGRYTLKDREEKAKILEKLKEKDRYIIVSTQVVEAGVDISSDILITDLAPPISLIQRMGRNARYFDEMEGYIYILRDAPHSIYNDYIFNKTLSILEDLDKNRFENFHPRLPWTYEPMLRKIYLYLNKSWDSDLYSKLMNPASRSEDILQLVLNKFREGKPFMRDFLIPIYVDEDILLVSPEILDKLIVKNKVTIMSNGKSIGKINGLTIAKKISLGHRIRIELHKNSYTKELGLII